MYRNLDSNLFDIEVLATLDQNTESTECIANKHTSSSSIYPVLLAGGSGTRLWPLSKKCEPKQFLPLCGDQSMLEHTLARISPLKSKSGTVVCNEKHRFLAGEQLRGQETEYDVLLEGVGRNTSVAITLAALHASSKIEDPILLCMPVDHLIRDTEKLQQAIEEGAKLAEAGLIATLGVTPTFGATDYGYIELGEPLPNGYHVKSFKEKPTLSAAEEMVEKGNYLWNSGIFLFKAGVYFKELEKHRPDILEACKKVSETAKEETDFFRFDLEKLQACPDESIDFALMEKSDKLAAVPLTSDWTDLGAWSAAYELAPKDKNGNAIFGETILHETHGCYVRSDGPLIGSVGIKDLIIVAANNAIFVAPNNNTNDVRGFIKTLQKLKPDALENQSLVRRPWGTYETLKSDKGFLVKRISVFSGQQLSIQRHLHRAEHWVVVSGVATILKHGVWQDLKTNETTSFEATEVHSLRNDGEDTLQIIEVQTGNHLCEEDIERLGDIYGRV